MKMRLLLLLVTCSCVPMSSMEMSSVEQHKEESNSPHSPPTAILPLSPTILSCGSGSPEQSAQASREGSEKELNLTELGVMLKNIGDQQKKLLVVARGLLRAEKEKLKLEREKFDDQKKNTKFQQACEFLVMQKTTDDKLKKMHPDAWSIIAEAEKEFKDYKPKRRGSMKDIKPKRKDKISKTKN